MTNGTVQRQGRAKTRRAEYLRAIDGVKRLTYWNHSAGILTQNKLAVSVLEAQRGDLLEHQCGQRQVGCEELNAPNMFFGE